MDLDHELVAEPVGAVSMPTAAVALGDLLLVAGREGDVHLVDPVSGEQVEILDLSDEVETLEELGMLGIASDGEHMWVSFGDEDWTLHVDRFDLTDGGTSLDPDSRVRLLSVEQGQPIHNGGHLLLGPDGMLYIGLGEGGDTYEHAKTARDPGDLHGSILRIDPAGDDGPSGE